MNPDGTENWFLNSTSALDCLEGNVFAVDDCQNVTTTVNDPQGTCRNASITIEAVDDCDRVAEPKTINVLIDEEDPVVNCSFQGQDQLILDPTGQGVQENVGLEYTATDNCGGPLDVTVEVYSNEIEDFQSQQMALLFQESAVSNKPAGLYIATTTCTTASNGQCIKDPKLPDNRVYHVIVSAIDAAGRAGSTECQIIIKSSNGAVGEIDESTQRFFLTSYNSVFTDVPPAASPQNFLSLPEHESQPHVGS